MYIHIKLLPVSHVFGARSGSPRIIVRVRDIIIIVEFTQLL